MQQLFLLAKIEGKETPEEWAWSAWQVLSRLHEKLVKDGVTLFGEEETSCTALQDVALPILTALGVAACKAIRGREVRRAAISMIIGDDSLLELHAIYS